MNIIIYNPKNVDYEDILAAAGFLNALLVKSSAIETIELHKV